MLLPWKNLIDLLRNGMTAGAMRLSGQPKLEGVPPSPRMVFRVGVTGHLKLPAGDVHQTVLAGILSAILDETNKLVPEFARALPENYPPHVELRLLTQLAAGVDQLAARVALASDYRIQAVLPFHRDDCEADIAANAGGQNALKEFQKIICANAVDAVFELPGDSGSQESRDQAYAEANRVILNQIDLLVVMVNSDARYREGGSVWFRDLALERHTPVIRIPLDQPYTAELTWFPCGQLSQKYLYSGGGLESAVIRGLLEGILTIPDAKSAIKDAMDSGGLTRAYMAQLPRAHDWDRTELWSQTPDDEIRVDALKGVPKCIDDSFREAYCWADFMARGYGEIYRGTAVLTSLLGTFAVAAAVLSIPMHWAALWLKAAEAALILVMIGLYRREKNMKWRIRWLNHRRLAEQLRHARYLILLGRTIPVDVPAHMQEFHEKARWFNWYVRALLRQASLPAAPLDRDYLEAVRWLLETRQVASQHRFYQGAYQKQEQAEQHLEVWVGVLVWLVLITTVSYIIGHYVVERFGSCEERLAMDVASRWVMVVGALFPAGAAALSAIKSHGEYAQNALRYQGMARELRSVEGELSTYGGQLNQGLRPAYDNIARRAVSTTAYLLEEVNQWRTILQMKVLERT